MTTKDKLATLQRRLDYLDGELLGSKYTERQRHRAAAEAASIRWALGVVRRTLHEGAVVEGDAAGNCAAETRGPFSTPHPRTDRA